MRSSLVVLQVSLSFVLLVGAGLLLHSLQKIRNTSPGFTTHEVLDTGVNLVAAGYDAQRAQNFQDELLDRVRALPGVESAAFARMTPLSYGSYSESLISVVAMNRRSGRAAHGGVQRSRPRLFCDHGHPA